MASYSEHYAGLMRALAARRAGAPVRLSITFAVCCLIFAVMGSAWAWIWGWGLAYAAVDIFGYVLRGSRLAEHWREPTRLRLAVMTIVAGTPSTLWALAAVPMWTVRELNEFAPVCAFLLLGGGLLQVIAASSYSRLAFLAMVTPMMTVAAGVVLLDPDVTPITKAVLLIGGGLVGVNAMIAWRMSMSAVLRERAIAAEHERRRAEAEATAAAKSAFVAVVCHELRTPISAILSGAAVLERNAPDAATRTHTQVIGDAGSMMRNLLNDLLDLSRIEAGRLSVEAVSFDARQTLSDVMRLWRPEAMKKQLRLRIEGSAGLPRWLQGDPTRLRQILNNLLSNAIKFTPSGSVTLKVNAEPRRDGRLALELSVVDTGPGFDDEAAQRLFTAFNQLNAGVAAKYGGSGLGLAISRELARLMGGELTVESRPGAGAAFTLSLDLEVAASPPAANVPTLAGVRVLAVDDHVLNRRALEVILEPFGVLPVTADSGETALEILARQPFDVVLMDLYMPGMDGRDAVRRLRREAGPNQKTPVIAVTASATDKDWEDCREAGMEAHVAKPVIPAELHAALRQVLTSRAIAAEAA
ncbi:ATP-binding protein [Caulobacter segnis]|uniref:ATP-binding protein n=1 Tax=Caulobacter segnis TaxID=88688 RepID=UPI00240F4E5C|nr:ATP-binding protein [Caulobacter segnis]MDG2521654.1 ATP-binding protein [Caulobacter segnis]